MLLAKGHAAPVEREIEAAEGLGMALWEMAVLELRVQSWPGVRVRPLVYEWAPERRDEMQALERAVMAEMRAAPLPPLHGTVVTGRGLGASFTGVPWARERLRALLGADPWPGTVNLRLDGPGDLARWRALAVRPGARVVSPEAGSCDARAYAARIGAVEALIVLPEVTGYPEDQVELVSSRNLRSQLGLADGDRVAVEVRAVDRAG